MKKIILYGSPHCGGCGPVKEILSENNVNFLYLDITGNMLNLKKYLKIRDNESSHKSVRENGSIGIPSLWVDGSSYVVNGPEHALELIKELDLKES